MLDFVLVCVVNQGGKTCCIALRLRLQRRVCCVPKCVSSLHNRGGFDSSEAQICRHRTTATNIKSGHPRTKRKEKKTSNTPTRPPQRLHRDRTTRACCKHFSTKLRARFPKRGNSTAGTTTTKTNQIGRLVASPPSSYRPSQPRTHPSTIQALRPTATPSPSSTPGLGLTAMPPPSRPLGAPVGSLGGIVSSRHLRVTYTTPQTPPMPPMNLRCADRLEWSCYVGGIR